MKIAEGELNIKDIFNNAHNNEINREIRVYTNIPI